MTSSVGGGGTHGQHSQLLHTRQCSCHLQQTPIPISKTQRRGKPRCCGRAEVVLRRMAATTATPFAMPAAGVPDTVFNVPLNTVSYSVHRHTPAASAPHLPHSTVPHEPSVTSPDLHVSSARPPLPRLAREEHRPGHCDQRRPRRMGGTHGATAA